MRKSRISKTAQVNLLMLADLGIEEAVHFQEVFHFSDGTLDLLCAVPMASKLPLCISLVSEVLYRRTNEILRELDCPLILDLACGYSPRVLKVCDECHVYIGADLPDVAAELREHRKELMAFSNGGFGEYCSADLTNREELQSLCGHSDRETAVITQGLLTYLTLDQKHLLMENIRSVLKRNGGVWIIPDAAPDRLLPEVFSAVLGKEGYAVFAQVMKILDAVVKRDRDRNGWKTTGEMQKALEESGFTVERVPLYTDTLFLKSTERLEPKVRETVIENWKTTSSLIVRVQTDR